MRFARAAKSSWLASGVSLDRGVRAEGTVATEDERSHVGDRVAGLSGTGCSTSGTATLASSGRPGFVGAGDTSLCANRAGGRGAAFFQWIIAYDPGVPDREATQVIDRILADHRRQRSEC